MQKNGKEVICARGLKEMLEIKSPYGLWMKTVIKKMHLYEPKDFVEEREHITTPQGTAKTARTNHYITIDAAIRICKAQRAVNKKVLEQMQEIKNELNGGF